MTRNLLVDKPYVEIGGVKWATMNIGANSETDYGLYFQWGDTAGYTSGQCGSNSVAHAKPFYYSDYKFNGGRTTFSKTGMTKYNSADNKIVLDETDDAAVANWGGNWRMPTITEFAALSAAVNSQWVTNYQGSGVNGRLMTSKTDSSKKLFFPAAGSCRNSGVINGGLNGRYWSSSLSISDEVKAYYLYFGSSDLNWKSINYRYYGFSVRPVLGS